MNFGYMMIVGIFLLYYVFLIIVERRIIKDAGEIIQKFLSVALLYAGISLIYFSLTGKPFLGESVETYNVYIFIIGFIALVWTIPNLLFDFKYFRNFFEKKKRRKK